MLLFQQTYVKKKAKSVRCFTLEEKAL